jgi:ribonucleoside-diphosphate reductase alpha chain
MDGRYAFPFSDECADPKAIGANPCVVAGTYVLTREGYETIESLVGKSVMVWNGEEWSCVAPRVTGHNQPIVKVKLSDNTSLICTTYHEWIIAGGERVRAKDLQPEDCLEKFAMPVVEGGRDWKEAYMHGVLCGDGQESGHSKGVLLYEDKKQLAPILEELGGRCSNQNDAYGRVWVGFPRNLPQKFAVPFDLSIKSRLDWFAGILDTDGAVLKNPNSVCLQVSSVNEGFLNDIRLLLTTLGVQAKVTSATEAGFRPLPDGHGGSKDYYCQKLWRLLVNASDTHKLASLGLKPMLMCLLQRDCQRLIR